MGVYSHKEMNAKTTCGEQLVALAQRSSCRCMVAFARLAQWGSSFMLRQRKRTEVRELNTPQVVLMKAAENLVWLSRLRSVCSADQGAQSAVD